MATAIRLSRYGKRGKASYRIIITDSRKKRDGAYIELLGIYDPTTKPFTVTVNKQRYDYWKSVGAQPSATVKSIIEKSN